MSLRSIDLNLVPVLQALLREKSVSRAAETLALSQPAASAALKRLRHVFDDQLMIRVGSGMVLTPRGEALAAEVGASCANLETLFAKPEFDPETAVRRFVVAAPDQAAFHLGPVWLQVLARTAPHVSLRFVELGEHIVQQLIDRDVDFAMLPSFFVEDLPPAPLHYQLLFLDEAVAIFNNQHPLCSHETLTADHLVDWRMIGFHPGSNRIERKRRSDLLGRKELSVLADVAQMSLVPFLLLETDCYGIISRLMAERLTQVLPLTWRPVALSTEPVEIGLAWSQVQDADLAHRWFRNTVAKIGR